MGSIPGPGPDFRLAAAQCIESRQGYIGQQQRAAAVVPSDRSNLSRPAVAAETFFTRKKKAATGNRSGTLSAVGGCPHGSTDRDRTLQLYRSGSGTAEDPVVAGEASGLGGNQDEVRARWSQLGRKGRQFDIQADDNRDPDPLPGHQLQAMAGREVPALRILLGRGQAEVVLSDRAPVRQEKPRRSEERRVGKEWRSRRKS